VGELARPHALFLFALGYFKLAAFATLVAAQGDFLSRLYPPRTRGEVIGGRTQALDLARSLAHETRAVLEKSVVLGARERIATRLIAVRMPEASVKERRRQARAGAKKRGSTPSQAHRTLLAWNLFITNVPATVGPSQTVGIASSLRWQVERVFKSCKSHLHLATLTTTTKNSTLGYLYGQMLLIVLTSALGSPLRLAVWQQPQRELSLLKLARHFQAGAEQGLQAVLQSPLQLSAFLSRACAAAERLGRKAVRKRRTSAQRLRESLGPQLDFFEPALALAA
jgi:hypothetical protein